LSDAGSILPVKIRLRLSVIREVRASGESICDPNPVHRVPRDAGQVMHESFDVAVPSPLEMLHGKGLAREGVILTHPQLASLGILKRKARQMLG
jgi:hypothetical protein